MPSWFPRSIFGTVLVIAYVAVAVFLVGRDRKTTSGGWISIKGLVSCLATFPVSALGERLGVRPSYDRNMDMAFAIGGLCGDRLPDRRRPGSARKADVFINDPARDVRRGSPFRGFH